MKIRVTTLVAAVTLFFSLHSTSLYGQVALKSNLLYDATTTPNLGVEVGLGRKSTAQLYYALNAWKFNSQQHGNRQAKHWLLMPEYRWWQCSTFNGLFFGVHAMGGQFNAANVDLPIPGAFFSGDNLTREVRNHSYEGGFLGAGVTCGYQWVLSRHWNIEAEAGVGYNHVWYDKYQCGECGPSMGKGQTNYLGLTKLGLAILYIF